VRLDHTGDARISQVKLEPATVLVRGPKEVLDRARFIATQPYMVTAPDELATGNEQRGQASLLRELEGRPVQTTPASVTFAAGASAPEDVRIVRRADHVFMPAGLPLAAAVRLRETGRLSLRLVGPAAEDPPPVQAYVDLTQGTFGRGRNLEPVRLQLPRDFQLTQEPPRRVAFVLEPAGGTE